MRKPRPRPVALPFYFRLPAPSLSLTAIMVSHLATKAVSVLPVPLGVRIERFLFLRVYRNRSFPGFGSSPCARIALSFFPVKSSSAGFPSLRFRSRSLLATFFAGRIYLYFTSSFRPVFLLLLGGLRGARVIAPARGSPFFSLCGQKMSVRVPPPPLPCRSSSFSPFLAQRSFPPPPVTSSSPPARRFFFFPPMANAPLFFREDQRKGLPQPVPLPRASPWHRPVRLLFSQREGLSLHRRIWLLSFCFETGFLSGRAMAHLS